MKLSAVILAAGFSSRMGEFKPLLPVGERAAIRRTVDCAFGAASRVIVVTGHRSGDIETALSDTNAEIVFNRDYETGMFSSVLAGLSALDGEDAFYLLPADCCAVSPDTLRELSAAYSGEILYPYHMGKRGHPPLIPARHAPGLRGYSGGTDGARGYLSTQPSESLETADGGILLDMDTPPDYARLLEFAGYPVYPADPYAVLHKFDTPADIVSHGEQTASVCMIIAAKLKQDGTVVDGEALRSAALLHDIARREDNHAERGAALLLREGYPGIFELVRRHMTPPEVTASTEEKILYLADKICRRGELTAPEEQLRRMKQRFSGDAAAQSAARERLTRCIELIEEFGLRRVLFEGDR